jgi:hypothetical protein
MIETDQNSPTIHRVRWKEFRESGLLFFINTILHAFGWVIVVDVNEQGEITEAFPARTIFRGFSEKNQTEGYKMLDKSFFNLLPEEYK